MPWRGVFVWYSYGCSMLKKDPGFSSRRSMPFQMSLAVAMIGCASVAGYVLV